MPSFTWQVLAMLTAANDRASGNKIRVQKAGGIGGRYILVLKYTARNKGQQKEAALTPRPSP